MKFRRKSDRDPSSAGGNGADEAVEPRTGPFDAEDLPADDVERVDLGSLLLTPGTDHELRLQVDESSGTVQAVLLAGPEGAIELRAFAAPRNGDLWSEVMPQIAADMTQRGGSAVEREGRWGTELVCSIQLQRPEGPARQDSRIVGINGSRWLLRATFLGQPARDPENAAAWEDVLADVAVRRGNNPMIVGEALPIVLPENARKVGPAAQNPVDKPTQKPAQN